MEGVGVVVVLVDVLKWEFLVLACPSAGVLVTLWLLLLWPGGSDDGFAPPASGWSRSR